jgi:NAD-dependent SIR2 family protein deacetylase
MRTNPKNEPMFKLAMSMHTNPGVYALLIGSGVSKAAGISTVREIVLDLIRKVAHMEREKPTSDLETWYQNSFGEAPDYSKLLDRLTTTSAERMALLRSYFEPTEEEREQGLKIPTSTHQAIATLAKHGYVRMILTTNFDRLIEMALEEAGIFPDVISSDDGLKGAMPYVHSRCVVVKLHGDYRDTRIKNTAEELANYSQELNKFLDRIFDEFGLLVCGWSGAWDTALRNAILRSPTRRFTTFWLAKGEQIEEAKSIIQQRRHGGSSGNREEVFGRTSTQNQVA